MVIVHFDMGDYKTVVEVGLCSSLHDVRHEISVHIGHALEYEF